MTLKFKQESEQDDRARFFIDMERVDLIESNEDIPEEMMEKFIKKRMGLVKKLKDFRKSQNSKRIWTRHRFSMLKGVRKWNKSLAGKRFHRQLGRFLATKITEDYDCIAMERYETLKALSSLRTHIYIEGEYFRPTVDDDVEFELLFEYALPLLSNIEYKLIESRYEDITDDESEILFRFVDQNNVISPLAEIINKTTEEIEITLRAENINEDLTFGFSLKYLKLLDETTKVNKLKSLMEMNEV